MATPSRTASRAKPSAARSRKASETPARRGSKTGAAGRALQEAAEAKSLLENLALVHRLLGDEQETASRSVLLAAKQRILERLSVLHDELGPKLLVRQPSGPAWVSRFPGSSSTTDLTPAFRSAVDQFIAALRTSGAGVSIAATYRPRERAYLMHYAWRIAREGLSPGQVPPMAGVDIEWVHVDSRRAAEQMVAAYGMRYIAALGTLHEQRRAIDMSISWSGTLNIRDAAGTTVAIASSPRDGTNPELARVGASFGVIKATFADDPHWSDNGS